MLNEKKDEVASDKLNQIRNMIDLLLSKELKRFLEKYVQSSIDINQIQTDVNIIDKWEISLGLFDDQIVFDAAYRASDAFMRHMNSMKDEFDSELNKLFYVFKPFKHGYCDMIDVRVDTINNKNYLIAYAIDAVYTTPESFGK